MRQRSGGGQVGRDVRYGSKADIATANADSRKGHVRFTPKADMYWQAPLAREGDAAISCGSRAGAARL